MKPVPIIPQAVQIENVVARSSTNPRRREDAWVSLAVESAGVTTVALVIEFKDEDYPGEAWAQAVKYGKRFADRLGGIPFRKRRGTD